MKELAKYLDCAAVRGTHGVRGTMRLENRCDSPAVLAGLERMFAKEDGGWKEYRVRHASVQKNAVLASFEEIDTVEAAAAMRGKVLYADRNDLKIEEGSFFISDMLGLPLIDNDSGKVIGVLKDVISPGGRQIYVADGENGEFMIPAVAEFIKKISLGEDCPEGIYVTLIEGMTN